MGPKEHRAFLLADLEAAERLLERFGDDDVHFFDRIGVQSRVEEIQTALKELDRRVPKTAEVSLYFYGSPVVTQQGIDARFSAEALKSFQDLVSKQLATQFGPVGAAGPIKLERESRLHITNVVRGSFGFELEELAEMEPLVGETPLAQAVRDVTGLIRAAKDTDEAFADAAEAVNGRVYDALRSFLTVVRNGGASFRISSIDDDVQFDAESLSAAVARTEAERAEVDDDPQVGTFLGVLLDSRTFEFRTDQGDVLRGKVERNLDPRPLLARVEQRCIAHLRIVILKKATKELRRYTLMNLTDAEPDPDDNFDPSSRQAPP